MPLSLHSPTFVAPTVHDIPYQDLRTYGVRALCFDLDNTLGPLGFTTLDPTVTQLLMQLRHDRFALCFGTNALYDRSTMSKSLDIPIIQPTKRGLFGIGKTPRKPYRKFFECVIAELRTPPHKIAMIGDKLAADVSGAMAVGMKGVLVNPVGRDLPAEALLGLRRREARQLARLGQSRPL